MALTFFKTPKNKKFNYKPVYYDKKKDEREKRQKSAIEDEPDNYEDALRARMQARWKRNAGAKEKRTSNTRLIIIILALALVLYLFFLR